MEASRTDGVAKDGKALAELFDSHCHLTSAAFADDLEAVVERAAAAGVGRWVTIASCADDARAACKLVDGRRNAWCTAGCHPHEADRAGPSVIAELREIARAPHVVAIGETGLDYHYDHSSRRVQRRLFGQHLELARELDLPVVVHSREADSDVAAAVADAPAGCLGVLHSFSGDRRAFEAAMAAAWYVSLSGMASFKNFAAQELVRQAPPERLLVETDSPYLSPVPLRGRRNEPARLVHVVEAARRITGESFEAFALRTTANARRFYRV